MRRMLASLVVVVTVVSAVAGATGAVFSASDSIEGNIIATGVINLTVNESAGKPFELSGVYPGYMSDWEYLDIYNNDHSPDGVPFEGYMGLAYTSGETSLWDKVWVTMKTVGHDSDCDNGDAGEKVIYDGYAKNFGSHRLVSSSNYWHLANEEDGSGTPADNIRVGYSERVCQKVGLHSSADSSLMGKNVEFTETITADSDND